MYWGQQKMWKKKKPELKREVKTQKENQACRKRVNIQYDTKRLKYQRV